jgi:hypothetical protein
MGRAINSLVLIGLFQVTVVVRNENEAYKPYDMAIDPYSRVIYWTCANRNVINITRLDSSWLGIRIMCSSEATCLSVDCCFSELAL